MTKPDEYFKAISDSMVVDKKDGPDLIGTY